MTFWWLPVCVNLPYNSSYHSLRPMHIVLRLWLLQCVEHRRTPDCMLGPKREGLDMVALILAHLKRHVFIGQ